MRYETKHIRTPRWFTVATAAALMSVAAAPAYAQSAREERLARRQARIEARQQAQEQKQDDKKGKPGPAQPPRRAALEQQYRARGEQVIREKLQLSDDQMTKLRSVNQRYDGRRRDLLQREGGLRGQLRAEVAKGKGANQTRVAQLMSQADQLQRERFELNQTELKEMGGFLTPVQQARYQGLQAQLRKRVQDMREQQSGAEAP